MTGGLDVDQEYRVVNKYAMDLFGEGWGPEDFEAVAGLLQSDFGAVLVRDISDDEFEWAVLRPVSDDA